MIRHYKGIWPKLGERAWVDDSAQVIGDVELGPDASVWMNSVVRGDVNSIRIGARSNIQDNCVVHVEGPDFPCVIGEDVTVGHSVTLHGCEVASRCLIGIGAIVLNGARIGEGSIVAAGALVPEGMSVPPDSVVMGVPAKPRRVAGPADRDLIRESAEHYVNYKNTYRAEVSSTETSTERGRS